MEIVFLMQYNLYRKKYEKYDNAKYQKINIFFKCTHENVLVLKGINKVD
jgi:hypothetical protein